MNPFLVRNCWFAVERDLEVQVLHWLELDEAMIASGWSPKFGVRAYGRREAEQLVEAKLGGIAT